MVTGCLALFFALGGVGYAKKVVTLINGTQIKRGSIPGDRLKKDSVTGKQVNESSLGVVPQASNAANATNATNAGTATNAGHAASADNASTLGGQLPSAFAPAAAVSGGKALLTGGTTLPQTVMQKGPLTISADCLDGGGGSFQVEIFAKSSQTAMFDLEGQSAVPLTANSQQFVISTASTTPVLISTSYSYTDSGGTSFGGVLGRGVHNPAASCVAVADGIG
jgi:hypothetical protein